MENHSECGPQLPKRETVVEIFKDETRKEDERMFTLSRFIAEWQSECESDPNPLTRAYFNISLGRLYIDIGLISEAKVSCECAKRTLLSLLPENGDKIPDDIQEACDEWRNLNGELDSLEPEGN